MLEPAFFESYALCLMKDEEWIYIKLTGFYVIYEFVFQFVLIIHYFCRVKIKKLCVIQESYVFLWLLHLLFL